jgi:hypothetical protein
MNNGSISGTTSATLIINPTATLDAAPNYNVVVSGACPSAIFSVNASLTLTAVNLSVELLNFSTLCEENKQLIQWQTASEFNSAYFILEKSRDGINWFDFETIQAAGNASDLIQYSVSDDLSSMNELNYYRLNQVDIDGTTKVVGPISSNCSSEVDFEVNLYPNPSKGSFMLHFTNKFDEDLTIHVCDIMGNEYSKTAVFIAAGENLVPMTIADLITGVYLLEVRGSEKVVKILFIRE